LRPLVLALLAAFPLYGLATPPAANVVPRAPTVGWRVSGSGAAAPVNVVNAAGGVDQSIQQTSATGIYNWQSFDIGSASSVTFNFPSKDASALNRVTGSTAPSQIFGALKAQYTNPDASKAPLIGGSLYLINANGILFGKGAQVNVGSLVASTLNLSDAEYLSGLTNSLTAPSASFSYDGGPALFASSNNFVQVDAGANITTASGGRVFLFAKNVQNAGSIATPDGQTVLAAGSEVYLQAPTAEALYASEVNPAFPALRGLLVEVGQGQGTVSNLKGGLIDTPRGNATLVGMAVNQSGRISATTSVTANGSVMLLARGNADGSKHASTSGALTLGTGSSTEITPDTTPTASGAVATADGNSTFTTSRVELAGKTISLQAGASIVAHGGIVDARAEATPFYKGSRTSDPAYDAAAYTGDDSVRMVIAEGASIDVSGTTDTTVSVARNFVTTQLLGVSDLKDAPLQKDGPLYRSKVTFDLRSAVPILGDTSAYQTAIARTVGERLASGGSISLASTGALVTQAGAMLNVSGGQVNYTDAMVTPTRLIAADGSRATLNQAAKDVVYTGIEGVSTAQQDRWGVVPQYTASQSQSGHLEQGYVDGQAGGTLNLVAPHTQIGGGLLAASTAGVRQTGGLDAMPTAGSITLGLRSNGADAFGNLSFISAGLRDLTLSAAVTAAPSDFWANPLGAAVPLTSQISAATLNASGAGKLVITADGGVTLQRGADLSLAPKGSVDIAAGGSAGINLAGNISAEGGSFSASTRNLGGLSLSGGTVAGGITLQAGTAIDVAGDWVNRALDGAKVLAATSGGKVTLSSAHALMLEDGSRIDVSGGATVSTKGVVQGTDAGSITLESDKQRAVAQAPSRLHLGATLKAQSLTGGGTLAVHGADVVTIAAQPVPLGVKDGLTMGSLVLSDAFFRNGAFTAYDVQAQSALQVQAGAQISPKVSNWIPTAAAAQVASGTAIASFLNQGQLPDAQRKAASLSLSAITSFGSAPLGSLSVGAGAVIQTDPLATVSLAAGLNLNVDGSIVAPGGKVNLALSYGAGTEQDPAQGSLRLGATSLVDVSGLTVLQPLTDEWRQGTVLAGGQVSIAVNNLSARLTPVEIMAGAVVKADGASDTLGVSQTTAAGSTTVREQTVSSAGGSISIRAQDGGALLAGSLHALGGDAQSSAGSFSLQLAGDRNMSATPPVNLVDSYSIVVQQGPITQTEAVQGSVQVSASALSAGFADASLQSMDRIRFSGDVNLAMARNLTLDAPLITASAQSRKVNLSAGGSLLSGSVPLADSPTPTTPLAGSTQLTLQGGLVEFYGSQGLQGFGSVSAKAASELRFSGVAQNGQQSGLLAVQADLSLSAPQLTVSSNSAFSVNAQGQTLLITGGDASVAAPLSAGGSLTLNAREITTVNPADATEYGVVRAPFGSLTLNASESITLGAKSLLSVSGLGQTALFGETSGGANWVYNQQAVNAPLAKTISLKAPGQSVSLSAGATLDASAGGTLLATEFVAGSGGSKDILAGAANGAYAIVPGYSGFAPQDADILALKDASGAVASTQLGKQIVIGAGAPVPAGRYTLLPARYALLPGAYLVKPVTSAAPLATGVVVNKADGSVLIGAKLADLGTASVASLSQTFQLMSSAQAQTYSEIRQTNANTYFTKLAAATDTVVPALPADAGRVNITANQLALKGQLLFTPTATGLGGELDLSADKIVIGTGAAVTAGVLSLNTADLNATSASLLVIGGQRGGASGDELQVTASEVTVDNAGQTLQAADVVLAAKGRVSLAAGAAVQANTSGQASHAALSVAGDGALLRVSGNAQASTLRSNASRLAGDLVLGAASKLQGASLIAEATHATSIAADASLQAQATTIGANKIAVGQVDASTVAATTLVITPVLAAQLAKSDALTLRSFDGLDLVGNASLGGAAVKSLTLDTSTLRVLGAGAIARIEAGGLTLTNTMGSGGTSSTAAAGSGELQMLATGGAGGNGKIVVGPGSTTVAGVTQLSLSASRELVFSGSSSLASSGALSVSASALQATQGATATLSTPGQFSLSASSSAAGAAAVAGVGAHVSIDAASFEQAGRIVLPSGELSVLSAGAVHFAAGSSTSLAGITKQMDGVTVTTSGGTLNVASAGGDLRLDAGATLDVSGSARAGSLSLSAVQGSMLLNGALLGQSGSGQVGATLALDSLAPVDLNALARTLAAAGGNNFSQSLSVRNRSGDQTLASDVPALVAEHISLSSDSGSLSIAGHLDAGQATDAHVTLAAGQTLTLAEGARITAHSTGSQGAEVALMAGTAQWQADGSMLGNGQIVLNGGVIDTSAATGGVNGTLLLRAQRGAGNQDVRITKLAGSTGTQVLGAERVEVEAVQAYQASSIGAALINRVNADNTAFAGADGQAAAQVGTRIAGMLATTTTAPLQLRAGVEIDQTDVAQSLDLTGNAAAGGWNLTRFGADGQALAQLTGAPVNLTLRAAGDLNVQASISDGYTPSGAASTTVAAAQKITPAAVVARVDGQYLQGGRIRLVGGADLGAANPLATVALADAGDVNIGAANKDVLVRSTTGSIQIAAGRDVSLLNHRAAVYTTGMPVDDATGYIAKSYLPTGYLNSNGTVQSALLSQGGSVAVQAARDVVGATDSAPQFGSEWLWRGLDAAGGLPTWWVRYDRFKQGFASLGGGNVSVAAGRDALNVEASAASSGYVLRDANGKAVAAQRYGGGDLTLSAGRDVVAGFVLDDLGALRVQGGRDIVAAADVPALQVLHGNSDIQIEARNNLDLGLVTSFGLVSGTKQANGRILANFITGLAEQAQLQVEADAGNLNYRAIATTEGGSTAEQHATNPGIEKVIADHASFEAPFGSVALGTVHQVPGAGSSLTVLAQQDATVGTVSVGGSSALQALPTMVTGSSNATDLLMVFEPGLTPLDTQDRTPLRIVAEQGDATISASLQSTHPLRLLAGRDVVLGSDSGFSGVAIQHQAASEMSLVQAGRDIVFAATGNQNTTDLKLHGPGDLLVVAGRGIDLKTSGGIGATGNRENAALPDVSANLTVLAGVSLSGSDYSQATAWYLPLLGGTGIAGHAADLAAQIAALNAGQALPALGSADAASFMALSVDAQAKQARALVGDTLFDAALLADAQRRAADASLSLASATTAFAKLGDTERLNVVGAALAQAWVAKLSSAQQHVQVLAMLAAQGSDIATAAATALQWYVGSSDLAQALDAFAALAPERQALFINQVLVGEIRGAGRAASVLSGAERDAAYLRAYQALQTVFSEAGQNGNLNMGSSQLRTLQGSAITVLTPRGGVNVGELVSGPHPKSASQLGIVTGAGGNISVAVRDDVNVNQSRVFTVGKGDLLMWSSLGNLDAGRGAKTVTGAPPPVFRFDAFGNFVIDTSGSYSGSGIAVLDASSTLDLYAPKGEINAGDAGIKSLGNAFLGAARFVGADNLNIGGVAVGAPAAASSGGETAGMAVLGASATAAGPRINADDSDEEKERKRRKRLNLILDFLGFGDGSSKS
jgi:filamentous hemagglutinin family protein